MCTHTDTSIYLQEQTHTHYHVFSSVYDIVDLQYSGSSSLLLLNAYIIMHKKLTEINNIFYRGEE